MLSVTALSPVENAARAKVPGPDDVGSLTPRITYSLAFTPLPYNELRAIAGRCRRGAPLPPVWVGALGFLLRRPTCRQGPQVDAEFGL